MMLGLIKISAHHPEQQLQQPHESHKFRDSRTCVGWKEVMNFREWQRTTPPKTKSNKLTDCLGRGTPIPTSCTQSVVGD